MFIKQLTLSLILIYSQLSIADSKPVSDTPKRPAHMSNRWQEDWSVLGDPRVRPEPFDQLKYIPLSKTNPKKYLSFGASMRERFESNDSITFGIGDSPPQSWLISRMEAHLDLHTADIFQTFIQLQSAFAPWKTIITPVDQNRLDLEQAFTALVTPLGGGTFKFRAGRQQFALDLQRFISVRDGPNVRLSFDALWGAFEKGPWTFLSFFSRPVNTLNYRAFDDYSSNHFTFSILRIEHNDEVNGKINGYIGHLKHDNVRYLYVAGNERRDFIDLRLVGLGKHFDWDFEVMGQEGSIAQKNIRAWGMGSLSGYTFENKKWQPRIQMQFDAASGNHHPHGRTLGTFNQLFPNGYYITLAGYTSYTNFIHFKPALILKPNESLKLMFATAKLWRESTADAIYTQGMNPVQGTAGQGGSYIGQYYQIRMDWLVSYYITAALEAVHFQIGEALTTAGGKNADYIGIEMKLGW